MVRQRGWGRGPSTGSHPLGAILGAAAVPVVARGEGLHSLAPLGAGEVGEGDWSPTEESAMSGERPPLERTTPSRPL